MGEMADWQIEQGLDHPECEWCDQLYGKHEEDCPTINPDEAKKLFKR